MEIILEAVPVGLFLMGSQQNNTTFALRIYIFNVMFCCLQFVLFTLIYIISKNIFLLLKDYLCFMANNSACGYFWLLLCYFTFLFEIFPSSYWMWNYIFGAAIQIPDIYVFIYTFCNVFIQSNLGSNYFDGINHAVEWRFLNSVS